MRFVVVAKLKPCDTLIVDDHNVKDLTDDHDAIKFARPFTACEFVSRDPAVSVKLLDPPVYVSCRVHPPPTPLNTTDQFHEIPFIVTVFPVVVAVNVFVPDFVYVIPAVHHVKFTLHAIFHDELHANVTLFTSEGCGQSIVKSRQFPVAVIVTVYAAFAVDEF